MTNDTYTPKSDDKLTVSHLITVIDNADPVKFFPQGGGFQQSMPADTFHSRFRKVEQEELDAIMWHPAEFDIDGAYEDRPAPGYQLGYRWNGWAQPAFEREGVERVAEIMNAGPSHLTFDEDRDVVMIDLGDEVDDDCRYEEYEGFDIIVQGGETKHVYAVGAGSWCWDDVEPDDEDSE